MTYDLTNLRAALSYTNSFEQGCMDCIYYGSRNAYGARSCRGPNEAEVRGVIHELELLGLKPAEVDEAVRCARAGEGGQPTSLASGHIGVCITPKRFLDVVESLLRTRA